jgi:hypothetical protein
MTHRLHPRPLHMLEHIISTYFVLWAQKILVFATTWTVQLSTMLHTP